MNDTEALDRLFSLIKEHITRYPEKVVEYVPPKQLREVLDLNTTHAAKSYDALFTSLKDYIKYAVRTDHPQYFNQLWAGFSVPGFMGEVISALCNTSMYTYEVAPAATVIEQTLLQTMLDIVGMQDGECQLTTGGSHGNMIALMIARNKCIADIKEHGLYNSKKLVAFLSAEAHYSFEKAANILGIGTSSLVNVPTDSGGRMDINALSNLIQQAQNDGQIPFFIAATAGTTVRGAFDPIAELRSIADDCGAWLHVDGAWGGSVILSSQREEYLHGIQQADSFVWDAHKMMGLSLMCSMLMVREKGYFDTTCNLGDTSYIFHDPDECRDLGPYSLQCGRKVDILKFWMEWKYYGQKGFTERIDRLLHLGRYAKDRIDSEEHLTLLNAHKNINTCFRFRHPSVHNEDEFNKRVRNNLYRQGKTFVNYGYLDDTLTVRLVIANHKTTEQDIDTFFDLFLEEATSLLQS